MEKRRDPRICKKIPICWQPVTSHCSCETSDAMMINHSRNGLYFESDRLIPERTIIWIRLKTFRSDDDQKACSDLRCVTAAEVKWTQRRSDGARVYYGVGAKYC